MYEHKGNFSVFSEIFSENLIFFDIFSKNLIFSNMFLKIVFDTWSFFVADDGSRPQEAYTNAAKNISAVA